jgi:acetate kinase
MDADSNAQGLGCISTKASRIGLHVIPTDEEWVIARDTLAALNL